MGNAFGHLIASSQCTLMKSHAVILWIFPFKILAQEMVANLRSKMVMARNRLCYKERPAKIILKPAMPETPQLSTSN